MMVCHLDATSARSLRTFGRIKGSLEFRLVATLFALIATSACGAAEKSQYLQGQQEYLVGPFPEHTEGKDQRFRLKVDRRYLSSAEQMADRPIPTHHVTFAVQYPNFSPVPKDALGPNNVVILSAGWEKPGSINRRVDGSWSNHYSLYYHDMPDAYGLKVRQSGNRPADLSRILFSPPREREVLIECIETISGGKRDCHMFSKVDENLLIEAIFSQNLLPRWAEIRTKAESIFKKTEISSGVSK